MPRYLCLQRTLPTSEGHEPPRPDMREVFARFEAWRNEFGDRIADLGGRLGDGTLLTSDSEPDGPDRGMTDQIGGYMIVEADSFDEAAGIARACPGLVRPGSGVEVREIRTQ